MFGSCKGTLILDHDRPLLPTTVLSQGKTTLLLISCKLDNSILVFVEDLLPSPPQSEIKRSSSCPNRFLSPRMEAFVGVNVASHSQWYIGSVVVRVEGTVEAGVEALHSVP